MMLTSEVKPLALHRAPRPQPVSDPEPIVGPRVELQLLTTLRCNLKCSYCSDSVWRRGGFRRACELPLRGACSLHRQAPCRQGGLRHLLRRRADAQQGLHGAGDGALSRSSAIQLQTNGTLLDALPEPVLARLSNILVSIDGGEAITDGYRGPRHLPSGDEERRRVREGVGGITHRARDLVATDDTSFEELDALVADHPSTTCTCSS